MTAPPPEPEPRTIEDNGSTHVARFAETVVELGYCPRVKAEELARDYLDGGGEPEEFGAALVEAGVLNREQARACERALRGRSTIGGFAILERVGQGGMGTVFRARQISMDRIVAVKILAPKFAQDPAFKQRFLNEARTSAKLSHLNIINGIDCGEDAGYTFFAMEFVEGRTVKQVLHEKKKLPPDEAFGIVRQMSDALSYARKFDLVHRDIKPDNIMIAPSGTAKLCDLGLAMQVETEQNEAVQAGNTGAPGASGVTAAPAASGAAAAPGEVKPVKKKGLALGTPHYMSPEQARAEPNIDARSDIYSLGATWYHLLTGRTLFDGSTSLDVMTQQVIGTAPNPCTLEPAIPRGVGLIISKMTAKAPADRYANADELLVDLNACANRRQLTASAFNARTSCAVLTRGTMSSGSVVTRWMPHVAAALLLGAFAYYGVAWLGGKNSASSEHVALEHDPAKDPNPNKDPVKLPADIVSEHHAAMTTQKPPDAPRNVIPDTIKHDPAKDPPKIDTTLSKPPAVPVKTDVPPVVDPGKKDPATLPVEPAVAPVLPAPPPELPKPELKLNADVLYSRFLGEVDARAGRLDLAKLYKESRDVSLAPEYSVARADLDAELKDLKAALDLEQKTLKHMADVGGDFEFSPDMARKWGVPRGKLTGYDETRGLSVEIKGGAAFVIPTAQLPADMISAKAQDKSALAQVRFAHATGNRAGVAQLLAQLPPEEQKRWQRKNELLLAKEKELTARIAFENMQAIAEAHSWKTLAEMEADFKRDFGGTPTAHVQAAQLKNWEDQAARSSQPVSKWRKVFHAASVTDVPGKPGYIELFYDFKTSEQALDFNCPHGSVKVENGRLLVPEGGGSFATLRLFAPFQNLHSFNATARSLHGDLRPFGVVFVEPAQVASDPGTGNTIVRLDPETKSAMLANWREVTPPQNGPPPPFYWLKDTVLNMDPARGGDKSWSVNGKPVGTVKVPGNVNGGWIALFGAQGNFNVSQLSIVFRPDPQWSRIVLKEKDPPPDEGPRPPPPPRGDKPPPPPGSN